MRLNDSGQDVMGTRTVRLLRVLMTVIAAASVVTHSYNVLTAPMMPWAKWAGWLIPGTNLFGLWLLQNGRQRWALELFLWANLLLFTLSALAIDGIHSPVFIGMAIFVMLTIWLADARQGLLSALLAALVIGGFGFLEQSGVLSYSYVRPAQDAALVILVLLAIGVLFAITVSADLRDEWRERRNSEARFRQLFQSNPLPSMLSNETGIVDVNRAWETMFGIVRAEALGRKSVDLDLWCDQRQMHEILARMNSREDLASVPAKFRRRNGEVREFLVSSSWTLLDSIPHVVISLLDQTERLAAEAALQALNLELESRIQARTQELTTALNRLRLAQSDLIQSEKLASLGSMVAGISHELNTPIGNAVTVSSTLVEQARDLDLRCQSGSIKKSELASSLGGIVAMASLIDRSVQRAATLITSFKQVAIDQTSERRREFDLRDVVEDMLNSLRPGMKHLPWQIDNDIPAGILCDSFPGPLEQILTNLIQNAVLHAFVNRPTGTITLAAQAKGDRLELSVRDDGVGMDTVTQVRIFDPFFTTKLGQGGSGLGLSICHRIATTVLAGELAVTSAPNSGSRFTLNIPLRTPGKL